MSYPSRATFLANSLVTVPSTSLPEECGICLESPVCAVQTPCKHVFCKSCITTWLQRPSKCTCPMCRTELFALDGAQAVQISATRREHAAQALRTSPLGQVGVATVDNFRAPGLNPTQSDLLRATASAVEFLARGPSVIAPGPVYFDTKFLAAHMLAMAHLIPEYAAARGNARYHPIAREDWATFVRSIWLTVKCHRGERDALTLPRQMMELSERDHHQQFNHFRTLYLFYQPWAGNENNYAGDARMLINYLIAVGKQQYARRAREREARGDRPCAVM